MTTTARTPYWFWSDDSIIVESEKQKELKTTEIQDKIFKLKPFEK